ncbi:UPF0175 family protein [Halorussus aquaticus]|uniref:UPF0175 family protein n=1 Tax=Halorussus aquaticus TaxID=2953748 RepID=A0ABD5Q8K1_9EURY|nr:UPF0175 family protein [Halorussus aquaticus]
MIETSMAATEKNFESGRGPFERLSTEYRSVLSLLESAADVFDLPSFVATAEEVVDKPAEERFRMSPAEVGETYGFGDDDKQSFVKRAAWLIGDLGGAKVLSKLTGIVERPLTEMREQALEQLLKGRNQEREALILGLYFDRVLDVQYELERRLDRSTDTDSLFACWHALISRVVLIGEGEQTHVTDDMLLDIAFAEYCLAEASGEDPSVYPPERSIDAIGEEVKHEGAVLAYEKLDISVSRGAELADVRVEEFEELLADHGIRPRYGPDDPSELFEGTEVFDSE